MYVDWKIKPKGDAGIYLRGTPQVQIWDTSRRDAGAQVGSGGLYNNEKNASKPLVVADNKIGEWNRFHIIMKGEKVTVWLNGILVTDNIPLENYWDRKLGAAIGIYKSKVDDMWFPYVEPQETGNRTDTRWITFTDDNGIGFKAIGMPLLSFSAWPFRMSELEHEKAPVNVGHKHSAEIVFSDDITVNLDYKQMGVGGDDSWGAPIHKEFSLPAVAYEYKFRLEPIATTH